MENGGRSAEATHLAHEDVPAIGLQRGDQGLLGAIRGQQVAKISCNVPVMPASTRAKPKVRAITAFSARNRFCCSAR